MHWHIITGSKGGVGKTLLTLLLLEYHLATKPEEGVLVLDLNAMNTDTSAMLLFNKRGFSQSFQAKEMTLQQTFSCNKEGDPRYFGVGWPTDPFALYGREQFAELMSFIKNHRQALEEKLEIPNLIHVIIDTNYHFCNLFSQQEEGYKLYTDNEITQDTVNVWFLWVYRQLSKLFFQHDDNENKIMRLTMNTFERVFKNNKEIGPIIHTYTPVGLMSAISSNQGNFLDKWFGTENVTRKDQDHTSKTLLALENLKVGQHLKFTNWIRQLQQAYMEVRNNKHFHSEDTHRLFINILDSAIRRIINDGDAELPINIVPLSTFQSSLDGYTDKEREDAVFALQKLTIYKNFSRLLDRKYESLIL